MLKAYRGVFCARLDEGSRQWRKHRHTARRIWLASALEVDRMSASQVSRICELSDAIVEDMQTRGLSDTAFPYVWHDAIRIKCRDPGHASSCAIVTAIGACLDGGDDRSGSMPLTRSPMPDG